MKLRNKKTGETGYLELEKGDDKKYTGLRVYKNDFMYKRYDSLAGVLEEWEDYKPKEPLIKDEKIRKAVRAWAEVNSIEKALYAERSDRSLCLLNDMGEDDYNIDFVGWIPTLKDGEEYTIDELCGEEEE